MKRILLTSLVSVLLLPVFASQAVAQNANAESRAIMILFLPKDRDLPKDYVKRIGLVGLKTEMFFDKWLNRWRYDVERHEMFGRGSDGWIKVEVVRENLPDVKAKNVLQQISSLAVKEVKRRKGLGKNNGVYFWTFYDYPGVKGFVGGNNKAVNAYPSGDTPIDLKADLGSIEMQELKIKGMIHEFGHALGLPHNGPRLELKRGNTLMGPITTRFMPKAKTRNPNVYLNETSAAMLWKHPLFKSKKPKRTAAPRNIQLSNLDVSELANGSIQVSGNITANHKAHTAIVFDSQKMEFGMDYWSRSFASRTKNNGDFRLIVKQPKDKGKLYLAFCFDNGINTGNGKKLKQSFYEITYTGGRGEKRFTLPK